MIRRFVASILVFAGLPVLLAQAQDEGPVPTQAIVSVTSKSAPPTDASAFTVQVNGRKAPLTSWVPVTPSSAQVALLIDTGLRESIGRELDNLKNFVRTLSPGTEVMVGYMQHGTVSSPGFTTDHEAAAATVRLPEGIPGNSASPYLCLSDFVKKWPTPSDGGSKARFVVMVTDGVDPYNGSTSVMNQDSPYVDAAIHDAQRAGVAVYAVYFSDAGIRGGSANFSGQSYLQQLAEGTGGVNFWQGIGSPVSTEPYLKAFQKALAESYVATFNAPAGHDLVRVKFSAPKAKLRGPEQVQPGNKE